MWRRKHMKEVSEIYDAILRLSYIGSRQFHYDPAGQVFGFGEIHYLVEVAGLFFIAWEDNDTRMMILNPITRFSLDELAELGAEEAWTVLHVPATLAESIQFRGIDESELVAGYLHAEAQTWEVGSSAILSALYDSIPCQVLSQG